MNAKAAISSSGQTNSLRFCSLSDARETMIIAIVAARYGTDDSQPTSTIPRFSPPLRIMDGSHSTKPYTPILRKILCAQQDHVAGAEGFAIVTHRLQSLLLFIQLCLQRRFLIFGEPFRLAGLSFTSTHQQKAQIIAGTPSMINISRQPKDWMR